MGMFDSAPAGAEEASTAPVEATEPAEVESTPVAVEPEKRERVELPKAPSRRAAKTAEVAQETITRELAAFKETWTKELSQRDQVIAELKGRLAVTEPLMQRAAQPQQPAVQEETPDQLRAKATDALDKGDVREYRRLEAEAVKREILAEVTKRIPQQQDQRPGMDPRLQVIMSQHPKVTMHPAGTQIATAEDMKLAALGVPNGPERWARAFQMAEASLSGTTTVTPQGFTQQAAGALAAVPTTQPAQRSAEREPGVELSEHEKSIARRANMSYGEYAKYLAEAFPNRVVR